jgi:hypothetical protein
MGLIGRAALRFSDRTGIELRLGRRGHGLFGGLLEAVRAAELLAESLDAAGGIDKLLFAGEERMALAANIDRDSLGRAAGDKRIAAGTVNRTGLITGMDFFFHRINSLSSSVRQATFARRQP